MGCLRVLLALAVLLGHTGGMAGYMMTGGPVAVQAFFIISGFYMALVLKERYDRPALNRTFYTNRALRIYSLYFVFLGLYLAVFAAAQLRIGNSPLAPYFAETVSAPEKLFLAVLNLTVIGQDLTLYLGVEHGHLAFVDDPFARDGREVFHFMAVPLAWSLALELYFYALAPFILRRPAWQIAGLMAASFAARTVAAWGGLTADPFSYRFFPFELGLFLAGALAYKAWAVSPGRWEGRFGRSLVVILVLVLAAYPALLGSWDEKAFFTPARVGTLALVALALPAVHGWSRMSRVDRAIGELSYPLYLSHFLVFAWLSGLEWLRANAMLLTLTTLVCSLLLSWVVVRFFDIRIELFRHRLARRAGALA